ncbi:outer membrane beta-barrel protein [Owenweeksia hongkongensis]|uniref:outer membrane beta-barrel protein n=1 Tax=Owenweeksia hongkongensis TaxID=253245 RepID=UPI003A8FA2D4
MKNINFSILLLFTLIFSQNSFAQQKQVFFDASVLSQPDEFNFADPTSKTPGIEFNLGYSSNIKKSNFIWEGQVSYLNAQAEHYQDEFYPSMPNDPFIPDEVTFKYIYSGIGIKAGVGYKIRAAEGKHSLTLTAGASGYLPFLSKIKTKIDDNDWVKRDRYEEDDFKYGILYGFYLKPIYQFRFKRNNPWAMHIFGEANLLWRNEADYDNPLLMAGGGIGFSYSLN